MLESRLSLLSLCGWLVLAGWLAAAEPTVHWHDAVTLPREGGGWEQTEHPYDRFPAHAKSLVRPPVWELAQNSAGYCIGFQTNSPQISVRWKLRSERLALPHMAATGVSGVDLYVRHQDQWRFLAVGRPDTFPVCEKRLVQGLTEETKEFLLYLPLYNGVTQVEIGIRAGTMLTPSALPRSRPQVVFYGTSITQGGCASRPGLSYPAILGRRLNVEAINLGFSGNGKAEPEVAGLLAELSPAVFVLDPLPNLETRQAIDRLPKFVSIIRERHPAVPIVLVENLTYTDVPFIETRREKQRTSNEFLKSFYEQQRAAGDRHLHYITADDLIGRDGEATVDAIHPTDAGFLRMAEVMEPILRPLLANAPAKTARAVGTESP